MKKRIATAVAISAVVTMLSGSGTASASPQTLSEAILATSPTYLYQLDEPTGATTAADSSVRARGPLTLDDVNTYGRAGTGLAFDGATATFGGTQYLRSGPSIPMPRPAVGHRAFTLAVSFEAASDWPGGVRYIAYGQGWRLWLANSSAGPGSPIGVGWSDRKPHADGSIGHSALGLNVATGEHQLVAVGVGHKLTLYCDGQVVLTSDMVTLHRSHLSVGSQPGQAGYNTFAGRAWDVAGWNRALTADEIAALWAAS